MSRTYYDFQLGENVGKIAKKDNALKLNDPPDLEEDMAQYYI